LEINEIDETSWKKLKTILPAENGRQGRPSIDNRKIINGILWRFQSKEAWRNIPEKYGKWITVYQRFRR